MNRIKFCTTCYLLFKSSHSFNDCCRLLILKMRMNYKDPTSKLCWLNYRKRLKGWNPETVRWLSIYIGNNCKPFVLIVETSLKSMNVHIINCKTLQLEYGTKPMNKHTFNDFISINVKHVIHLRLIYNGITLET